jgi:hypothetical protein
MKYKNTLSTFVNKNKWICFNSEAIVLSDDGQTSVIVTKESGQINIPTNIFNHYFSAVGPITLEDQYEFNLNNKISLSSVVNIVKDKYPQDLALLMEKGLKKAYQDAYTTPGDTQTIKINTYLNHLNNPEQRNILETLGSPFFNRRPRWSPIANEDDWNLHGAPAPIGIRTVDYASLRECNLIFKELVIQIFTMLNVPLIPDAIENIQNVLGINIPIRTHICSYCGENIDIFLFNQQQYSSREPALNFCHRDPSETLGRTRHDNIYFGHTRCNRIQGGLSEKARIEDGLRLLLLHDGEYITHEEIQKSLNLLFDKLKK